MPEFSTLASPIQNIARYLERHAEPEAKTFPDCLINAFDSIIVIPVFDESGSTLERFIEFCHGRRLLLVWVFNAPESAAQQSSLKRTRSVKQNFLTRMNAKTLNDTCYLADIHASSQLLIVDRCQHLIPDKQGVGLARKIGADLALCLSYRQYLHSGYIVPWIYSTDADVTLPRDYAMLAAPESGISACVHPFEHTLEGGYEQAMRFYEFSLHYYVDQLAQAGSPYAFHTIGSLIAVTPLAYAQVRGFPKRSGAEDFYLLNKLAKVGKIETLVKPVIRVAGRPSHRVPFGTGPALLKIQADQLSGKSFELYHPRIFVILRALLEWVSTMENCVANDPLSLFSGRNTILSTEEKQVVIKVLNTLGWHKQQRHLEQKTTAKAWRAAFHIWFDAFLTLRFVHELRDQLYPNIDIAKLPSLLDAPACSGAHIDYFAWFKNLGISA